MLPLAGYNSNNFNPHINDTIVLRATPALPTTPQYTKFYIPWRTTVSLSYTTATSEPATRFLPLRSLPGKLHQPAYDRLQLLHSAAGAHLWHYCSLTELHTFTNHVNGYLLVISLPTDYTQQLLQDNNLDYFARDYISHSTSIKSHYTLHLPHYQEASLINYNFNNFSLHYTLANGYICHLYTLHPNDSTARRVVHCIVSKTTEYYGHYLLANTHGSEALHAQLLRTGTTHHDASFPGEGLQQDA